MAAIYSLSAYLKRSLYRTSSLCNWGWLLGYRFGYRFGGLGGLGFGLDRLGYRFGFGLGYRLGYRCGFFGTSLSSNKETYTENIGIIYLET
jgi:hypothetical protein